MEEPIGNYIKPLATVQVEYGMRLNLYNKRWNWFQILIARVVLGMKYFEIGTDDHIWRHK